MKRAGAVLLMLAALSGCVGSERPAKVSEARSGYVVRTGDTLSSIATRNGLILSALARANGIAAPYLIRVGQHLTIPKAVAPVRRVESRPVVQPLPTPTPTPMPTLAPRPSATTGAPRLVWPTDGPVAEIFGTGADPRGIAFATLSGAAVRAAAGGTVVFAGTEPQKYDQLVLVDHGGGWVTAYGHIAKLVVRQGETVRANARLGFTGGAGNDARLHFELRRDNQPRDPLPLLPARF